MQEEAGSAYCSLEFVLRPNWTSAVYSLIGFGHLCSLSAWILIGFVFLNFHFDYWLLLHFEISLALLLVAFVKCLQ